MKPLIQKYKKIKDVVVKYPLYQKYQDYIPSAVYFTLSALIFIIFVWQVMNALEKREQINVQTLTQDQITKKVASLENIDQTTYTQYLNSSLIALPQDADLPSLINVVNSLVRSSGMTLDSMSFSSTGPSGDGAQNKTVVNIMISGSSFNFDNFLVRLDTSPRILKVQTLNTSVSNSGVVQATMTLNAFFERLPSGLQLSAESTTLTESETETLNKVLANSQFSPVQLATEQASSSATLGKFNPFE